MYSAVGMIVFPIPLFLFDVNFENNFTRNEYILIFWIGVSTFLYIYFMALGLQHENAGRVSLVNYFQVAFMYVSDITMFHKEFVLYDSLGTLLIFSFNFANGVYKFLKRHKGLDKFNLKKNKPNNADEHNSNLIIKH